jgi:hypothetical protein
MDFIQPGRRKNLVPQLSYVVRHRPPPVQRELKHIANCPMASSGFLETERFFALIETR